MNVLTVKVKCLSPTHYEKLKEWVFSYQWRYTVVSTDGYSVEVQSESAVYIKDFVNKYISITNEKG